VHNVLSYTYVYLLVLVSYLIAQWTDRDNLKQSGPFPISPRHGNPTLCQRSVTIIFKKSNRKSPALQLMLKMSPS